MTQNIINFENPEFGNVRILDKDGEPWFVAADVCRVLDIKNSRDAVADLDDDEKGVVNTDTLGGKQEMRVINEIGLYNLIFRSRKPEAKKFRKWVTAEVLPSIRKTGSYSVQKNPIDVIALSDDPIERCEALTTILKAEKQKQNALIESNNLKDQQIEALAPKANYCDIVLQTNDVVTTTIIAKDYGKSAIWLNNYLKDKCVQYKQRGTWVLYQKYADMGLVKTKTTTYEDNDGTVHSRVHLYWTEKGRMFIYDLLKQDNILPLNEKEDLI